MKRVNVAGILVAAAGIMTQFLAGVVGFPTIPPGPIILVVAAALVVFGRRWSPIIAVVAPLFVLIGGAIATAVNWGSGAPLSDPSELGGFVGAVVQFVGLIVAVAAGVLLITRRESHRSGVT
jgi:hypothetical protein